MENLVLFNQVIQFYYIIDFQQTNSGKQTYAQWKIAISLEAGSLCSSMVETRRGVYSVVSNVYSVSAI